MKALLVTMFRVPNFGSVLQAYATQYILKSLGIECKVLNYDHNNSEWSALHNIPSQSWKNKIGRIIGIKARHRKEKKLQDFTNKRFNLTRKYTKFQDIKKNEGSQYDLYVIGSDQVWNTRFSWGDPIYLLNFVTDNKAKCISISSSFACKELDKDYLSLFVKGLQKFSSLSVREPGGIAILEKLGFPNAKLLLDPTLLLSRDEWLSLSSNRIENNDHKEKYILLYLLCYAFEPRPLIFEVLKYYQEKMGYKIIALEGYEDCVGKTDLKILDKTDSSISDFIDLFANASLVVTSSFHGTAFAVNFGKPLISITPNSGDDRQSNLLRRLNLENCQLQANRTFNPEVFDPNYDEDSEQIRLAELRKDSLHWISCNVKK